MIPDAAVEAAAIAVYGAECADLWVDEEPKVKASYLSDARLALEAAAPHMLADEAKLAAVILALDPFERVAKWMTTDDEAGRYALEAVHKIRAILDGAK